MRSVSMFSSLRARDFRWLWLGSLASSFAMNMQIVARGWLVYDLTASPLDLGWVTLSFTLPQILFSLWGGVIADRLPKRSLIVTGQTLNFGATLVLASVIFTDRVTFWDFIWFGAFNGTVLALSMPARQAFVPELVGRRRVFNAMALNTTSWNLARVLGPTLAGGLIAVVAAGNTSSTYGVGIVFFMIAALYFVAAVTSLRVRKPGEVHADKTEQSPLADIAEGFRYVVAHPPVFGLIMLSIVPFLFGMPINTLLPAFTEEVLGGGPDDLGVLLGTMGVGAIAGSLMLARMGDIKRKGTWLIGTCVAWGLLMATFANATWLSAAAVLIALVGWASAWNMSLNRGLLQVIVSPDMRGRILSIDMMSHGLMPLGILPIAYVAETMDIPTALMLAGGIFVVTMLAMWLLPSVRSVNAAEPVRH